MSRPPSANTVNVPHTTITVSKGIRNHIDKLRFNHQEAFGGDLLTRTQYVHKMVDHGMKVLKETGKLPESYS